jgi:hypothetical protein
LNALLNAWDVDHATLAKWATCQPNNQRCLNSIAASWASSDADAAGAWLQTLPTRAKGDALRAVIDAKLPVISRSARIHDLQEAERWIVQLSNRQMREDAYEELAKRWLRADSDPATAWIKIAPLPQATRDRLLE